MAYFTFHPDLSHLRANLSVSKTMPFQGIKFKTVLDTEAWKNTIPQPQYSDKGIRLEFAQFGHFDSFEVFRSLTPMDALSLPEPHATGLKTMRFMDNINLKNVLDRDLYYRVRVIRGTESMLSAELKTYISTFNAPQNLIVAFANNALEMEWDFENVTELHYYCSESPIDINNLPLPKAVIAGNVRTYVDTDIEIGKTYYVRVGSVKNGVEKLSDEKVVRAGGDEYWSNVVSLLRFENRIVDDTGRVWNIVGNPVVQNGALVLNGSSGLTTSATGFNFGVADFTIEAFLRQESPNSQWREIFMSNASGGVNIMFYDKKLAAGRELIANDYVSTQEVAQNELKHIAVSRNSGVLRGFIDGNKVIEGSWLHSFSSSALHSLGSKTNGTSGLVGSIDKFRVTNGVGRYTSNFVPQDFLNF